MNQRSDKSKSPSMRLLEMFEGFYLLREPITFSGSKLRISFLKNYIKFSPSIFSVLIAGFVAWAVYSGTEMIWLAVGIGILTGAIGYGSAWLGIWLVKKFFISYINDYQKVFEPESKPTNKTKTYKGLRAYWIFIGIIDFVVVTGILYHYRGLLGLILSIVIYLPSIFIYLWIFERAMEGHPVVLSHVKHRVVIVLAVIFFQIFFFWWLLEIGQGAGGWLGIGIVSIIFIASQIYIYFYSRKRRHNRQISP